jgi:hypothetical protein
LQLLADWNLTSHLMSKTPRWRLSGEALSYTFGAIGAW